VLTWYGSRIVILHDKNIIIIIIIIIITVTILYFDVVPVVVVVVAAAAAANYIKYTYLSTCIISHISIDWKELSSIT